MLKKDYYFVSMISSMLVFLVTSAVRMENLYMYGMCIFNTLYIHSALFVYIFMFQWEFKDRKAKVQKTMRKPLTRNARWG